MPVQLITMAEAYDHLRIDTYEVNDETVSDDDAWLTGAIYAVSAAVVMWLKDAWRPYEAELDDDGNPVLDGNGNPVPAVDDDGNPIVLWAVKWACLMELESLYRFRGGEGVDNLVPQEAGHGYVLNKGSTSILTPLRRSTVA